MALIAFGVGVLLVIPLDLLVGASPYLVIGKSVFGSLLIGCGVFEMTAKRKKKVTK